MSLIRDWMAKKRFEALFGEESLRLSVSVSGKDWLCPYCLKVTYGDGFTELPIEERKELLAKLLNGQQTSIVLNQVYEADGAIVFSLACRLGCEGIVSKLLGSTYRRGRSPLWVKVKNPNAPAVKREAEEDWGR